MGFDITRSLKQKVLAIKAVFKIAFTFSHAATQSIR
jgi:hypothetical protein